MLLRKIMASADMRDELSCSICLNIYTDPVTLKCGHNFCRMCIDQVLDTQEEYGACSCPECRDKFTERPELQRNFSLSNISERFHSTWRRPKDTGISCTYCVDSPVPAVKSCLLCDAYLCERHLRVHSKSPEHVLTDPNTSLEGRKCPVHKKILEYYCTVDGACVCVSCSLAGEHRGHQVEMLDEACEKTKVILRNELQKAVIESEALQSQARSLEEHRNKFLKYAPDISEKAVTLFRKKLEELDKNIFYASFGQNVCTILTLINQTLQLLPKRLELSRKIQDLEELCDMTDPLTLLQRSGPMNLHGTSSAELPKTFPDLTLPNLDVNNIHSALHRCLDNAVSEIKRAFPVTPVVHHARQQPNKPKSVNVLFAKASLKSKWPHGVNKPASKRKPTKKCKLPSFMFKPRP